VGFDHEVADGEDEPRIVDDDPGALAFAAEIFPGEAVRIDEGLDADDARQQLIEGERLRPDRRTERDHQGRHRHHYHQCLPGLRDRDTACAPHDRLLRKGFRQTAS
jgi:hypothetical protein